MSPRRDGDLSPLLVFVIAALEAHANRDRRREGRALRAFGQLARVQIPARGVFAPTEDELYRAIDAVAVKHLGLRRASDSFRAALTRVEPFDTRDAIAAAANHLRTISEGAYFDAGLAFGVTFADLASRR